MSILVVCPGCKKSFQVNDKFAGKSGPCPKCKATIRIPAKTEEVKIHTPEEFASGGRSTTGKLVTKPIARAQVKIEPVMAAAVGAAIVCVLLLTWFGGGLLQIYPLRGFALLIVSPVLVLAAYTFLRDEELEPYRSRELYIRAAACGATYVLLWAIFAYVRAVIRPEDLWQWFFMAPPFLVLGSLTAWVSLDLEPGNGFFHYTFYLLVTMLLGWIGGLGWIWDVPKM